MLPTLEEQLQHELLADPRGLLARVTAEEARRSGSKSFAAFVKQAWSYVPQTDPLLWGWHMDALCIHFEEIARGRISRLLVNCPPGHAKSIVLSVLLPAWIWTWWPRCQFLFASYSAELAVRDSVRCRAVIESDWYRATHAGPGGWTLRHDQNAKGYFMNTAGGERYSVGIGGTGRRAHIIGIDDPLDTDERHSKAARDRAKDWIGTTLSQRFVDASTGRIAMIMQRLHEEDPSGFVLKIGGWEHLVLPSEFDSARRCVTYHVVERKNGHVERIREEFWRDPREHDGELLFPQKFSREVLDGMKAAMGPSAYAALHSQRPMPVGMARFKKEWVETATYRGDGRELARGINPPPGCRTYTGVDLAVQQHAAADLTVLFTIVVHPNGDREVLEILAGRWAGPEIVERIVDVNHRFKSIVVLENVAAQEYIAQFTRRVSAVPLRTFTTGRGKASLDFQAESLAAEMANGKWIIPNRGGRLAPEVDAWVQELLYYDPREHCGDRLAACLFARHGADQGVQKVEWKRLDLMAR